MLKKLNFLYSGCGPANAPNMGWLADSGVCRPVLFRRCKWFSHSVIKVFVLPYFHLKLKNIEQK